MCQDSRRRSSGPGWSVPTLRLSALHTEELGVRSVDILHVAAALVLGLEVFLTFDTRQRALARLAGLKAPVL